MLLRLFLFLILFIQPHISASDRRPPTLRVLIMCDTTSSNIKKASFIDLKKMRKMTKSIAKRLKLKQKTTILRGKSLSVAPFTKWMKNLPYASNDIVIFYYSGHGFRLNSDIGPWPTFPLGGSHKNSSLVTGKRVYDELKRHTPRFALVIFDCCNYEISLKKGSLPKTYPYIMPKGRLPGLRTLFSRSRGMVTISASSPGEFGLAIIGGKNKGSLFTSQFLLTLLKTSNSENITWQQVIKRTSHQCSSLSDKTQNPVGLVEVF